MADRVPLAAGMTALDQRLLAIAPHLGVEVSAGGMTTSLLLSTMARSARGNAQLWLLMTGVCGIMPTREEFVSFRRAMEFADPGTEMLAVLDATVGPARLNPHIERTVRVVDSGVVVDVDFCARHGHNTGIQRVVRETVRRWSAEHELLLVAWTDDGGIYRTLAESEHDRVVGWASEKMHDRSGFDADQEGELVIPWESLMILPEVASDRVWKRLACAAEFSGNTTVLVGYDAIPITSAEYVVPSEADRFIRYLSVVKHATILIAISESSANEFRGFSDALGGQGLEGPAISSVLLPIDNPTPEAPDDSAPRVDSRPLVLCVGTQEPRKNQLAVLFAAETLWQRGDDFELLFIGNSAIPLSLPFDAELERLRKAGRPVSVIRYGSDAILRRAYLEARFSVFISQHEGFGLPVGESLSLGTPVLATNYGSIAEVADGGGCLLVDPRDDNEIVAGMARLLTDEQLIQRLRDEARARSPRTWDDYARELWSAATRITA